MGRRPLGGAAGRDAGLGVLVGWAATSRSPGHRRRWLADPVHVTGRPEARRRDRPPWWPSPKADWPRPAPARRWRRGGDVLHHILDPRTGLPARCTGRPCQGRGDLRGREHGQNRRDHPPPPGSDWLQTSACRLAWLTRRVLSGRCADRPRRPAEHPVLFMNHRRSDVRAAVPRGSGARATSGRSPSRWASRAWSRRAQWPPSCPARPTRRPVPRARPSPRPPPVPRQHRRERSTGRQARPGPPGGHQGSSPPRAEGQGGRPATYPTAAPVPTPPRPSRRRRPRPAAPAALFGPAAASLARHHAEQPVEVVQAARHAACAPNSLLPPRRGGGSAGQDAQRKLRGMPEGRLHPAGDA